MKKPLHTLLLALLQLFLVMPLYAAGPQSAAAWIAELEKAPADAALEDLLLGCYYRVSTRPALLQKLTPEQTAQMQKYDAWVESEGNALADQWASGPVLAGDKASYLGLAQATYYYRAWNKQGGGGGPRKSEGAPEDERVKKDMQAGAAAMKKGFLGEPLSQEDLDVLSSYRVLSAMKLTDFKVMPFEYGVTAKGHKGNQEGEIAPDFGVLPFEAIAKLSSYTDELRQDVTTFLKPQGVIKFLQIFDGYERVAGGNLCQPKKEQYPEGVKEEEVIRLSGLRGKPVVFVLAFAPDVFLKVIASPLESLQYFYGEKAHIIHINECYHDSYATGPVYAGSEGGNEAVKVVHPQTWEQKARMSRAVALTFPSITYALAIDSPTQTTRNAYCSEGGAGQCVIVDKDGKIVYDPGLGWMYWTKGPHSDNIMWLNETEIALRHALGLPAAAMPATRSKTVGGDRPSKRAAFEKREAKPYGYGAPNNYNIWLTGKIEKVVPGVMTVMPVLPPEDKMKGWSIKKSAQGLKLGKAAERNFAALEKWRAAAAANTPYLFKIEDDVELFVNGEEVEADAFKPGDAVAVWYDIAQDATKGVKPIHVRTSRL